MNADHARLRHILCEITPRDQRELILECLKMGMTMERGFFGSRLGRRQAVIDHALAFMDFVGNNVIEDAEEATS